MLGFLGVCGLEKVNLLKLCFDHERKVSTTENQGEVKKFNLVYLTVTVLTLIKQCSVLHKHFNRSHLRMVSKLMSLVYC